MEMQRGVRERDGVMGTELNAASAPAVRLGGRIDLRRKLRATFSSNASGIAPILPGWQVTVSLLFP